MDCLRAQELISEALDRVPVDPTELAEAKSHCRSCAECGAFVRTLLAVQRAPVPEPPHDLPERVMERVRHERERKVAAAAAAAVAPASAKVTAATAVPDDSAPRRSLEDVVQQLLNPRRRASTIAWAAAAAAVFIVAGIGAIAGVRQILIPPRLSSSNYEVVSSGEEAGVGGAPVQLPEATQDSAKRSSANAPNLIVLDGIVYRLEGDAAGFDASDLERVGSTYTSLDAQASPTNRRVLQGNDPARVFIDNAGRLQSFSRVSRHYQTKEYVLTSGSLTSFGQWPTLPSGVPRPAQADGSPAFTVAGTDDSGATIYKATGVRVEEGFAVGPNPTAPDPMVGDPDWTWWVALEALR